jgi:hypothetical protein
MNRMRCSPVVRCHPPIDAFEEQRVTELRAVQSKAQRSFRAVEARGLIRSSIRESRLNGDADELAKEMCGITNCLT